MVRVLRLKKAFAQLAKEFIQQKGWLATGMSLGKSVQRYILIPLNEKADAEVLKKKFAPASVEHRNLKALPPTSGNLKHLLQHLIPEKKLDEIIKSYDTIGDICILDIPKRLEKFELVIGHAIKRAFPHIKVVAKKEGKRTAIERIQPLKIITGEKRLTTTYKENGVSMKVDLAKVYFSPRASRERLRIASLVKKGENVLVMFGGVAPYALTIANLQPNCRVWTIELNKEAHKLAEENIRINRAGHIITAIQGDVAKVLPELDEKFDRIIMPFPEKDWDFLDLALRYASTNAMIHFIAFVHEDGLEKARDKIIDISKSMGRKAVVKDWRLFGSYAPRVSRYTFDILVK